MADIYHVLPTNDVKTHLESSSCHCQPQIENNLVIHNAYDGREFIETVNWYNESQLPKGLHKTEEGFQCFLGFNRPHKQGGVIGVDICHENKNVETAIKNAKQELEFLKGESEENVDC